MNRIFFDTEFTGLHQATTLISIGMVNDHGDSFYAELTDFDQSQVNDWLRENVLSHLVLHGANNSFDTTHRMSMRVKGDSGFVKQKLTEWLALNGNVQMWSDCLAFDWVLFNTLLADYSQGYPQLPSNVHYIPMDICTLFQLKGVDPDINREKFGLGEALTQMPKHNALWDAQVIKACYDKLVA
ncbi:3'-5' exoribonuclease [Hymenobacter sp. YC55]|uniref:3'-5' exoribonuclease domain-containing protein n=1 Tax=Hymenobacter sp. YC55 TaxID=3034019 RepID=UPI0023F69164|nr:3'-5' exoribonuclease [Hymenobacter sp. YC55]MDF7810709.1 3'-5' exoribonuclease [Hymenobacter sp. YC55]